jgi:hypothetical protein
MGLKNNKSAAQRTQSRYRRYRHYRIWLLFIIFCLDDSILDQSMSDHETNGQETPTSKPEQGPSTCRRL